MKKKYIPSATSNKVVPVSTPAHQTPDFAHQPLQNAPNQAMPTLQPASQNYSVGINSAWSQQIAKQLASRQTVDMVPVQQPAYKLLAPDANHILFHSPLVPVDVRMPQPNMSAPNRLQSVPGYVVFSSQGTTGNANLASMYKNLRAPSLDEGGSGCG